MATTYSNNLREHFTWGEICLFMTDGEQKELEHGKIKERGCEA